MCILPIICTFLNIAGDKYAWMKDEEFGRQTLAGINPCTIQLVKVYKFC